MNIVKKNKNKKTLIVMNQDNPVLYLTGYVHLRRPHDYNVCRSLPQGVVSFVLKIGQAPIAWYILERRHHTRIFHLT